MRGSAYGQIYDETDPKVDPEKFGPHGWSNNPYVTEDCANGCGAWMGPYKSGGPCDPFGACPKNPKVRQLETAR